MAFFGIQNRNIDQIISAKGQAIKIVPNALYQQGDPSSICARYDMLPFKKEQFNAIIIHQLHMLDLNIKSVFSTLMPYLHPGGLFLISTLLYEPPIFSDFPALHAIGDALSQHGIPSPIIEKHRMTYTFKHSLPQLYFLAMGLEAPPEESITLSWAIAHGWKKQPQVRMPESRK
jgi:hypothetical protein